MLQSTRGPPPPLDPPNLAPFSFHSAAAAFPPPLDLSRIPNGDCLSNGGGAFPTSLPLLYSPPRGHYTLEMFVDETD